MAGLSASEFRISNQQSGRSVKSNALFANIEAGLSYRKNRLAENTGRPEIKIHFFQHFGTRRPGGFTGRGYGHGVGLSQEGAINMARQGFTYIDILKFYYLGIAITTIDELTPTE